MFEEALALKIDHFSSFSLKNNHYNSRYIQSLIKSDIKANLPFYLF